MMRTTQRLVFLAVVAVLIATCLPHGLQASSREVLLQDLRVAEVASDLYHQPERPGKVVRVVPWFDEGGSYAVLAITETGWVYRTDGGPSHWVLVGRIFEE